MYFYWLRLHLATTCMHMAHICGNLNVLYSNIWLILLWSSGGGGGGGSQAFHLNVFIVSSFLAVCNN